MEARAGDRPPQTARPALVSNRECNNTKRTKGPPLDLLISFLKENATISREQKDSPDTYTPLLG